MVLWIKSEQCEMPQKTHKILVKVFYRMILQDGGQGNLNVSKIRGEIKLTECIPFHVVLSIEF